MDDSVVFARLHQVVPHLTHSSFSPPDSTNQMASRSVESFCTAHGRVSSGMPGQLLSPGNSIFSWGNLGLIYYVIPWAHPESKSQTASRSVQPFCTAQRQSVPILCNGPPLPP